VCIYLSLGSNIGNRKASIQKAVRLLSQNPQIDVKKCSSFYETSPVGVEKQPWFVNCAVEVETDIKPKELLKIIKDIELSMGRENSFVGGPREIDIDIVFFKNIVLNEQVLEIPLYRKYYMQCFKRLFYNKNSNN